MTNTGEQAKKQNHAVTLQSYDFLNISLSFKHVMVYLLCVEVLQTLL